MNIIVRYLPNITKRRNDEWQKQSHKVKESQRIYYKDLTSAQANCIQNDLIEEEFNNLNLKDYVNKIWLEITCGEAPYMCSRYDATTGEYILLSERVGFVDRKLNRISSEVNDHKIWLNLAYKAYKLSYGYEFQGDSLIIARENLVYSFIGP